MTAAFCSWFQTKEQVSVHGWTGACKQARTCVLVSTTPAEQWNKLQFLSFSPVQHKVSGQMSLCYRWCWVFVYFFFFLFPFPIISLSPFLCPVVGMESVIEKQHCWNQLKKSLSSCGVKKPFLRWTLELAPFIHFSPASSDGAGCLVGMLFPEDPLTAARHGGTSHLLNLDFLNLPATWHIDKQPRFLAKVGNAHSLAVNCFVVLNHKNCSDSRLSKHPAMQAVGTKHTEIKVPPSLSGLWASWLHSE